MQAFALVISTIMVLVLRDVFACMLVKEIDLKIIMKLLGRMYV
jgi:hypothetical protein